MTWHGQTTTMGQELLLHFADLTSAGSRFATLADSMVATTVLGPQAGAVDCSFAINQLQSRATKLATSLNRMSQVTIEVSTEMSTWDESVGTRFPAPLTWGAPLPVEPVFPGATPGGVPEQGAPGPAPFDGYVQHPDGPYAEGTLVLPPDLVPLGPPSPRV